ncbi:MAG: methyltransferase domain-containing protein [Pseudomonadota bacterium]
MAQADLWSPYWQADPQPASIDAFPTDVRDAIELRWLTHFRRLPAGARVLDIGCGAGALAVLAARAATAEHPLDFTGIDLAADVPTAPATAFLAARFLGGQDAAALSFGDAAFDLVVSQFGFEYGDFDPSLIEAARVCRGALLALVHAADGSVVQQNAPLAGQVDWLLDERQLPATLRGYLETGSAEAARDLKGLSGAMVERARTMPNAAFLEAASRAIGEFIQAFAGKPAAAWSEPLERFEAALRNHGSRMRALGAAGRSESELRRACERLRELGFATATVDPLLSPGGRHLVGYWLEARRPL